MTPTMVNQRQYRRRIALGLALGLIGTFIVSGPVAAEGSGDPRAADIEAVVRGFNEAVSERDLPTLIGSFVPGAVQLNLRAAHAGAAEESGLTTDVVGQWRTIAPVLFANTFSYRREVTAIVVQVEGGLATAWAGIRTVTQTKENTEPVSLEFSEIYTLFHVEGAWKIVAVANNRPTR